MTSPFFTPGLAASPDTLALIHLKRDLIVPTILRDDADHVANTRFGSFPHSTLFNLAWGAQVLASKVDTGSRARNKGSKKRKREDDADGNEAGPGKKSGATDAAATGRAQEIQAASSGFAHLLPPTPELWTISLPHRTQVVYTPDYSYILQRLRVRPGDSIIEAGAGSGSFTHAAARAVFNGYADAQDGETQNCSGIAEKRKKRKHGRVYSFEFHESRSRQLREEIKEHGLDTVVTITHRDVYQDGFCLPSSSSSDAEPAVSPQADAIFLDLPAPWLALKHLTHFSPSSPSPTANDPAPQPRKTINNDPSLISDLSTAIRKKLIESGWRGNENSLTSFVQYLTFILANRTREEVTTDLTSHHPLHLPTLPQNFISWLYANLNHLEACANPTLSSTRSMPSPLNQHTTTRLCTFSPCIEQVQRTVAKLRDLGWVDIAMVEVQHKRLDVRRERVGLGEEGLRGVNAGAASVEEALGRLREVEGKFRRWGDKSRGEEEGVDVRKEEDEGGARSGEEMGKGGPKVKRETAKQARLEEIREKAKGRRIWKDGRIVHRTEPEIKTHTSYLVFAVLPRVWTERDEERARRKWGRGKEAKEATAAGSKDAVEEEAVGREI